MPLRPIVCRTLLALLFAVTAAESMLPAEILQKHGVRPSRLNVRCEVDGATDATARAAPGGLVKVLA